MSNQLHRIGKISFAGDIYCLCYCGERIECNNPNDIPDAFQRHRASLGLERKVLSGGSYADGTTKRLSIK